MRSGFARPSEVGPRELKKITWASFDTNAWFPFPTPSCWSRRIRTCTGSAAAATAMPVWALPGLLTVFDAGPSFPAALTGRIPWLVAKSTVMSSRSRPSKRVDPPRLMLIVSMSTPSSTLALMAALIPARMIDVGTPSPVWSKTLMMYRFASGAIPISGISFIPGSGPSGNVAPVQNSMERTRRPVAERSTAPLPAATAATNDPWK